MRSRSVYLRLALTVAGAAFTIGVPVALALAIPTAVVATRADENHGTAGWNKAHTHEYVAFARKDERTGHTNAFLRTIRPDGSVTTVRLNTSGEGNVGGFYGRRVLYAQDHNGAYDLRVFDIPSGSRWAPAGVNTRRHEWLATRSGPYLLFNRDDRDGVTTRVVLHDLRRTTAAETVLERRGADGWVYAGQVRGNWATWTACTSVCDVFRYDIANHVSTAMPKPSVASALSQYDGSVTADGTVYLVRSGPNVCNSIVEVVRFGPSDPSDGTVIARLPQGRFTTMTYARENGGGTTDLFFARGSCATLKSDIVKLAAAQAAS